MDKEGAGCPVILLGEKMDPCGAGAGGHLVGVHDLVPGGRIYTGRRKTRNRDSGRIVTEGCGVHRANPPVTLLRSVPFGTRSEACRAEAALKRMPGEKDTMGEGN